MSTLYRPVTFEIEVANMNSDLVSEGLTYQWFAWVDGEPTAIENATEATYTVPLRDVGAYYCEVTNHMGEFTAVKKSPTFNVYAYEEHHDDGDEPPVVPTPSEPETSDLTVVASVVPVSGLRSENNENYEYAAINQAAVENISRQGNVITLNGDLDNMVEYTSAAGTHKFVAVDLDTGLDSIVGVTWDGSALTAADVSEAHDEAGLGAGHIVYWAQADVISNPETPRVITLGKEGYNPVTITVRFEDTQG
jgi:hypothetical protein